ncbi:hypothetical protein [Streptomyces gibsoniae]|uniref:Uncharacterized protein n=1 Tax=Streptomyces gibsoniae TaxID=3075529 RepID=A0ABU2TML2_9ACTN|nr:hypothetical protein [Streptomyces sp. DSM 41699]MDT0462175.1 hypothetical protein [Streptomyces sp. DSM 41699]
MSQRKGPLAPGPVTVHICDVRPGAPVVLVANGISEPGLLKAVGLEVVAFLSREEATFDNLVEVEKATHHGHAPLLGPIVRHFRQLENQNAGRRRPAEATGEGLCGLPRS